MQAFHVNSSLPRSGSELMQALLGQHPDVYASSTSPLLEFWFGAQSNLQTPEVKSQDPALMDKAFKNFCKGGLVGYCEAMTDKPVFVDKSKGWIEMADFLWGVSPESKLVCMVRNVDDIIKSMEAAYRRNPGHPETRHLPKTSELRAQFWLQNGNVTVGVAINRINDRKSRGSDPRIRYIDYDQLVDYPIEVMRSVFEFMGLDKFDIDPNNVVKSAPERHEAFGIFGNHEFRNVIARRGQEPTFNKRQKVSVGADDMVGDLDETEVIEVEEKPVKKKKVKKVESEQNEE